MSCTISTSGSNDTRPTESFRSCSFCRKLKVPITLKFKLCNDCREYCRKARKKHRENRRKVLLGTVNTLTKRVKNDSSPAVRLGSIIDKSFISFSSLSDLICTEYQTSSELFEALKSDLSISTSNRNGQLLQFQGSYTIVAASDIDNLQRVQLLATELSTKPWLPFQFVSTHISTTKGIIHLIIDTIHRFDPPLSLIGDESMQTLRFSCTCHSAPSTSSHNDENMFATSTTHDSSITPRPCGGTLILESLVDKTHPLGIPGQHIIVRVEHPRSYGLPYIYTKPRL